MFSGGSEDFCASGWVGRIYRRARSIHQWKQSQIWRWRFRQTHFTSYLFKHRNYNTFKRPSSFSIRWALATKNFLYKLFITTLPGFWTLIWYSFENSGIRDSLIEILNRGLGFTATKLGNWVPWFLTSGFKKICSAGLSPNWGLVGVNFCVKKLTWCL